MLHKKNVPIESLITVWSFYILIDWKLIFQEMECMCFSFWSSTPSGSAFDIPSIIVFQIEISNNYNQKGVIWSSFL